MTKFSITPLCYFFTEPQVRLDTTVVKSLGVSFFWPLYLKNTAALFLSVALKTLPPVFTEDATASFFQQDF